MPICRSSGRAARSTWCARPQPFPLTHPYWLSLVPRRAASARSLSRSTAGYRKRRWAGWGEKIDWLTDVKWPVNRLLRRYPLSNRDKIIIKGLLLRAIIGIEEWERRDKQDILIDLTLFTDAGEAGQRDDVNATLNYRTITKAIIRHVEESQYQLVEALATAIARVCVVDFQVPRVIVRVEKPGALRFARSVGIEIEREAGDFE
ncbi:MAG: dihydroneopterin aldolase [Anaerolineae bacterium]|nr:dihydroneopterin aldolase [Anaerolineae bacterium]